MASAELMQRAARSLALAAALVAGAMPAAAQQDTAAVRRDSLRRAIPLEALMVSSTRSARRVEDEPLRLEIVDREEIEEKLRMTPGDIAMLLNETGGVRVQSTAPSLGGAAVRIQGLRGRYAQILSDGLPLHGEASGLGPLQIPPMDLARVEVIKGAASALHGASALGGVVNLISRRPDGATELLLNRTTRNGTDAVVWHASDEDARIGWTLTAGAHDQRRVDVDDDGWTDIPGYTRFTIRPRVFVSSGRSSLMVTAGETHEDRSGGGIGGAVDGVRQGLDTRRFDGGVSAGTWLTSDLRATLRASAVQVRHDHVFSDHAERDRHRTLFAEFAIGRDGLRHSFVAGAALHRDTYEHTLSAFDQATTTPGVFAQGEWRPAQWIAAVASARADAPSGHDVLFSPRLSVLLRPADFTVRVSAGGGHHLPGAWIEEVDAIGLSGIVPLASRGVEHARSGSLDIGREIGALELNGTLFGSVVDDALALFDREDVGLVVDNVPGETRTWGAELLARVHAEGVHATASYAFTRATEPDPEAGGRREVQLTPRHTAGLVVAWEQEDRGRIGAELYYTGVQALHDDPYRTRSRPYAVFGVLAERRIGRARVFVNLENIGNVRQTRYAPFLRPGPPGAEPFTTDAWAPLDGRVINAGLRFQLRGADHHAEEEH